MKFFREVGCSTGNDPFKFCADPDHDADPGILADFVTLMEVCGLPSALSTDYSDILTAKTVARGTELYCIVLYYA